MTRRAKIWLTVAVLFILVNVAGTVVAAVQGELTHAIMHAGLAYLTTFLVWRFMPRRVASY